MKKVVLFLSLIVCTFLLSSCNDQRHWQASLDAADSMVDERSDSALTILDSLERHSGDFSKPTEMRWRLLRLKAQNKCDTVFRSDSLQHILTEYYDKHGTPNERMTAHYLLGRAHYDMGEVPMALESYQQAVESADTTSKYCDFYTLTAIYGQMADLFHMQYLPDNEMETLIKSERYALKDNDTLAAIKAYELRIRPYFLKNDTSSMMHVMTEAQKRYLIMGDKQRAARSVYSAISILLDRHQYDKAKKYLDIYEHESGNFDENGELINGGFYYYDKGRYMLAIGKRDSAIFYFRKLERLGIQEAAYKGLLSAFEELHDGDSIAKYALLYAAANDSSYLYVNQENVHLISAMYNYNRQRQYALQKGKEADRWKYGVIITILSSLIVISLIAYGYKLYKQKKQKEIDDLLHKRSTLETLLEEKRNDTVRLNNKNARLQRSKNEQIEILNSQIENLKKQLLDNKEVVENKNEYLDVIRRFKERFQEYNKNYKPPSEEEWIKVSNAFRICHADYHDFITSTYETDSEYARICMMIMMNFSERMMAIALCTDGKHIDRRKRQINKKSLAKVKPVL